MLVTIAQFRSHLKDDNGVDLPVGADWVDDATPLTAAGESDAMASATKLVRIATDTAVTVDAYGDGSSLLLPAGCVEFFPATGGQTFTFATLA